MTQISQIGNTLADPHDPQTNAIIGVAMEILRQLGHGVLEPVYQDAAVFEFPLQNIPYPKDNSA